MVTWRTATGLTAGTDTSAAWTLPTGNAQYDLLIAIYGGKPYDATVGTPSGYSTCGSTTSGTVANGNGTGSTRVQAFYKVHSGSESNPSGTVSATPSPRMTAMLAATGYGTGWTVSSTTGQDTTLTGTGISATGGSITVSVAQNYQTVTLSVLDNGPGVPHNKLQQINQRWVQGAAGEALKAGHGLGLAIVGMYAKLLGASVELKQVQPQGLCVSVAFRKPQSAGEVTGGK